MKKELSPDSELSPETEIAQKFNRTLIRASFITTIFLTTIVAWLDIESSQAAWWLILSIMLLPLLGFSHTVLTLQVRGLIWLCCVLCLYFIMSIVAFITTPGAILHGLLALSTTLLFCCILAFVRTQTKNRKIAAAKPKDSRA